jgi:hypothetical protein
MKGLGFAILPSARIMIYGSMGASIGAAAIGIITAFT